MQHLTNMPGYRFGDYSLVLTPHEDLRSRIMKLKKDFSETYKAPSAVFGMPHITIVKFRTWEMMEEKIVNHLKRVTMGLRPFKVSLQDFGTYPSHTIYINVATKLPIQELSRSVRTARKLMKSPDNDPYFVMEPSIVVAAKLSSEIYDKAWLEFSHKHFTASFAADSLLLLKKREGERAHQIVKRFDFINTPVTSTQAALSF